MAEARLHSNLAGDRWHRLALVEQMANVGSEVGRAVRARTMGNEHRLDRALDRTLELFDLTLADPRLRGRRQEICRAREVVLDYLVGTNEHNSTADSINGYFLYFGAAARRGR
ncbi:MAG: hypothetical protein ACR2MY_04390 [Candidatus Dormibacteria bacterium]